MIGFVRGKIDYIAKDFCVVEAGGIGYRIFMANGDLAQLHTEQEIKVYTYLAVREDAMLLYGFLTRAAYSLFMELISVSGIGPKVALGVMSGAKVDQFYLAIQSRDLKYLTKLPGIGKKTAERMLLELKDKVGGAGNGALAFADSTSTATGTGADEAVEALMSLGYTNSEIIPVLQQMTDLDKMSTEAIVKQTLKIMAGRK